MDNKLLTPDNQKGRWIHEGKENKLHPRYLICEFIDNSIEHSNADEELNIEIVWNERYFYIRDNANGITDWETSLKRHSKELKNSKSEFNVGMKDAIQFFGMQAIIYSASNSGKKAYYINAHFEEDDPKCTWKDNEGVIAWDEYEYKKIPYDFEQFGTLIHIFDLHENRKNHKKIKELSPKNFKRLMHFIGTRYYRDFINRNINITFDFFGEKETINALFIKSRLIPTEYFTIREKKDLLHFQNKEHTWDEMILERLNDINDSIYIGEKYKKEFKSIEGFKSSLSFFNILSLDGSSYSIEDLWKPFLEPQEDNYPVLKWEFIWETNLNDYLDEKMQFHIKLGIPTRIGQKNKMKYQNTLEDFGISIYQHNRGIHIMEKSLKKKPWINEFTNQVGSGVLKLENFELEFHFPTSPKIRTEKNKIHFNDELIQIIKECFLFEVYTKMSLCHITLLGHSLKMNSKEGKKRDSKSGMNRKYSMGSASLKIKQIVEQPKLEKSSNEWIIGVNNEGQNVLILKAEFQDELDPAIQTQEYENYADFEKENSGDLSLEKRQKFNEQFNNFIGDKPVVMYKFNAHKNITQENLGLTVTDRSKKLINSLVFGFVLVLLIEGKSLKDKDEWIKWFNENIK